MHSKRNHIREIYLILIIIFIFSTGFSWNKPNCDDLIDKSGLAFMKDSSSPFDGKCISYHENKNEKNIITYKNGKYHNYKLFYDNGKLLTELEFDKGLLDGETKIYYSNGEIKLILNYKGGKRNGKAKVFFENGNLMVKTEYKSDVISNYYEEWYSNGNKQLEVKIDHGVIDGDFLIWHENGKKMVVGEYNKGKADGKFKGFYNNGNLKCVFKFDNGKLKILSVYEESGKETKLLQEGAEELLEKFAVLNSSNLKMFSGVLSDLEETTSQLSEKFNDVNTSSKEGEYNNQKESEKKRTIMWTTSDTHICTSKGEPTGKLLPRETLVYVFAGETNSTKQGMMVHAEWRSGGLMFDGWLPLINLTRSQ